MKTRIARLFLFASLAFLIIGCVEGLLLSTRPYFQDFYKSVLNMPPKYINVFFSEFIRKIHAHITLVGWLGCSVMGAAYYLAPEIGKGERYRPRVAYANFILHVGGLVLMCLGFHMIGTRGFASGFEYGSPGFRQAVGNVRLLVPMGGGMLLTSALCFAYNIGRTLFGPLVRSG